MREFWRGFSKQGQRPLQFKKHVILVFFKPGNDQSDRMHAAVNKISFKYPTVRVKLINVTKKPMKLKAHNVNKFPSVLLLRNGQEVDRLAEDSLTLLERLFRRAQT